MVDTFRPLELGEAGSAVEDAGVRLDLGRSWSRDERPRRRRRRLLQQLGPGVPTFIAFLRAVNVGKRKYPMAELRAALAEAGFDDVETHIQTGNVRLRTSLRSRAAVVGALEEAMLADRGFAVPVVLLTPAELVSTCAEAEAMARGRALKGHYLSLLAHPPDPAAARALEARSVEGEEVRVGVRAVHLMLAAKSFHEATTGNAEVERLLGTATTRNLTVVSTLSGKWGP